MPWAYKVRNNSVRSRFSLKVLVHIRVSITQSDKAYLIHRIHILRLEKNNKSKSILLSTYQNFKMSKKKVKTRLNAIVLQACEFAIMPAENELRHLPLFIKLLSGAGSFRLFAISHVQG